MSELQILKTHRNDTGTYSCSAVSDIGTDEATIQYIVQGRPDPPTDISVVNITSRSVTLQWEVKHDGNSHVTGSVVQYQSISVTLKRATAPVSLKTNDSIGATSDDLRMPKWKPIYCQ
ncbi:hypothetical protein AVEN_103412-1 [Araneus ventricosus]|uniref:Fibronectin type-III domain-containing protein n=1 Tax=Araneus ventricosus TaxID=182803 RepID=A0A4Y2WWV4_ARAVE|nr:hypothetical protein AVEN_103412-1 [Araneus ventricosus]